MELTVISPKGILLKADTDRVSLPGTMGPFTVLKEHAPLLSTLEKGTVEYQVNGASEQMEIDSGLVEIKDNVIRVYIENY